MRLDVASLEDIVTDRLRAEHTAFEHRLIGKVHEQARGGRAAALGLSEVVGALNQARVAHLVYDPFIRYRGSVGDDGSLYAEDETALTAGSTADLRLTERIVERALETGAQVTRWRVPLPTVSPRRWASLPFCGGRDRSAQWHTAGRRCRGAKPRTAPAHGHPTVAQARAALDQSHRDCPARIAHRQRLRSPAAAQCGLNVSMVSGGGEDGHHHPFGTERS